MTVALLIACSALLLEDQDLVVLEVLQNLAFYRGAFYHRCAYLDLTVVVCEQDFVEAHRRVCLALKTVNIELPTFFSLKLLTCNLYYYVHLIKLYVCEHNSARKYSENFRSSNSSLHFFFFGRRFGIFFGGLLPDDFATMMHRIAILSDDDFLCRLVTRALAGLGAEVCCAGDWDELERCPCPDVVVLLSAGALTRVRGIGQLKRAGGPRVYVLSWHHSERMVLALLERGADQCLTFPVNLTRLRRKIAEELISAYE